MPKGNFDPVCPFHNKKWSEHYCLYCQLCFEDLTPDECYVDADGIKWDVHKECKELDTLAFYGMN